MVAPQTTFAMCCIWFTILMFGRPAVGGAPPADEPLAKLAVLDPLVGSWMFGAEKQDGFSARQECKWILNKRFLEIATQVLRPGHPPSSWRTLITYDKTGDCYRQWKFSDNGAVSTAHGAWNENTSSLILSGRTPNGNDEESSVKIIDDNTMIFAVREFLDDKHTRVVVVRFALQRVPSEEDQQPTNP